jgi:outer membrane autotransporter protein
MSYAAGTKKAAMPVKAPAGQAAAAAPSDLTYWANGYGAWGKFDGDGNAAELRRDLGGFLIGFDRRFIDTWWAGLAAGYSHSSINAGARSSSASVNTPHIAGYTGGSIGAVNLRGGAAYAWHDIDANRFIVFPGFSQSESASYHGSTTQVFGEIGYGMNFGSIAAEPFAGLAWVNLDTGSFSERGGTAALAGSGNNFDTGYSSLGVRLATTYMLQSGMILNPRASVAWQHAFNDVTPTAALAFQSTGASFTVAGVPLARDSALVEAGVQLRVTRQAVFGVSYTGQLASNVRDHGAKGNFTWTF